MTSDRYFININLRDIYELIVLLLSFTRRMQWQSAFECAANFDQKRLPSNMHERERNQQTFVL